MRVKAQPKTGRRPVVSVCIVNWNCRDMLHECLRSLNRRRQRLRIEIIVVDNASTDGAADMVERDFPRVKLIRNNDNAGFARGNNQAASMARGRYLFFLNNDTVVPPGALCRLVEHARSRPRLGLLGPLLRGVDGRVQLSARRRPTLAALAHRLLLLRWSGLFRRAYRRYRGRGEGAAGAAEVLMGAALLMPRNVFHEVGGWDEAFTFGGEDIELCSRVRRRFDVVYHPAVEIIHFGRASSRKRIGFVYSQTVIGITRSMHCADASRPALAAYKAVFTLEAPMQLLLAAARYSLARLRGRREAARRAALEMRGVGYFLCFGLPAFWRA
jgi:N-acetylglucosaminyl-diphospho-decaprenol L-rhamnosyltransferase